MQKAHGLFHHNQHWKLLGYIPNIVGVILSIVKFTCKFVPTLTFHISYNGMVYVRSKVAGVNSSHN